MGLESIVPQEAIGTWVHVGIDKQIFKHTPEWNAFIDHITRNVFNKKAKTITVTYEWDE
jgi:hypothetical protein